MTPWITIAGWTLVHFLWQGAVIGATAAVGLALLRAATPQARYGLAATALALMLLSPLATVTWLSAPSTPTRLSSPFARATGTWADRSVAGRPVSRPAAVQPTSPTPAGLGRMFPAIVSLWGTGVVLLFLRLLNGWWHVRRLHRGAFVMPASRWQAVSDRMADRLCLPHRVHVIESSAVNTPAIIGWWRPVLLLPLTALAGLTPSQAEAILAHELVHVRRHDYVVNILQRVTETVLFYHPAVWWISHRMRIEREQCCDAVVVRMCGDAADYATALVRLDEARGVDDPVLVMAATGGALVDRIRRILSPLPNHRRSIAPAIVTSATVLLFVLIVSGGYRRSLRTVEGRGQADAAGVIATVNGEPITQADLDHFRPLHGEPANTPLDGVLVQLIDERLLVQRGRALGFVTKPDELRSALAAIKDHNHIADDAALDAQLAKQHLTRADLEQHLLRSRVVFHVGLAEARNGLAVTDREAQQYLDAHLDEFPLQTFDLAKPALVSRLTLERLGRGIVPASYVQPLRSAAAIVWTNSELQRAYADGLAAEAPKAQAGTPVPGQITPGTSVWQVTTTDHFEIFATADVASQIPRVQQVAERAYRHVSDDLRHDLDVRPSLVLFATDAAARAANGSTLPKVTTPSPHTLLPLDQSESAFETTVRHEIAHTFAFNIVPGATLAAAPTWIVEGLSEYKAARGAHRIKRSFAISCAPMQCRR